MDDRSDTERLAAVETKTDLATDQLREIDRKVDDHTKDIASIKIAVENHLPSTIAALRDRVVALDARIWAILGTLLALAFGEGVRSILFR